jgi:hypothetical protein
MAKILNDIIDAQIAFIKANNGKEPQTVHVTRDQECELGKLRRDDIGSLAQEVVLKGVRKVFPTLYGMKVVWDAPALKVE